MNNQLVSQQDNKTTHRWTIKWTNWWANRFISFLSSLFVESEWTTNWWSNRTTKQPTGEPSSEDDEQPPPASSEPTGGQPSVPLLWNASLFILQVNQLVDNHLFHCSGMLLLYSFCCYFCFLPPSSILQPPGWTIENDFLLLHFHLYCYQWRSSLHRDESHKSWFVFASAKRRESERRFSSSLQLS